MDAKEPLLKEGKNCWRIRHADRVSFLVDGADYFEAFASAVDQAERTIYIACWDIDSRISLSHGRNRGKHDLSLEKHITQKVKDTPSLHVYILYWDFAMIYALEREWLPLFKLGWKTNRRVHFFMDDEHPLGASQHQKIVVVDDALAFSGGIDLTKERWDTPEHRLDDPRRKDPAGRVYKPFHDVQMVVDGDVATALGDLFRDRWWRATGKRLSPGNTEGKAPWPHNTHPDIENTAVAVSRTLPMYKGREEVREVESLYTDAISAAENYVYIENQYLTSSVVAESLSERLENKDGPEIVVILPRESGGWLEKGTMDAIRTRVLGRLFEADRHGRLRVFYPVLDDRNTPLFVHAKVMISDDRFVRVGSANLSNRSMGLDSECDLSIEAHGEAHIEKGVRSFRDRLLAEHLGTEPQRVAQALEKKRSLIQAIESLRGSGRGFQLLDKNLEIPFDGTSLVPDISLIDPERPAKIDHMMDRFVHNETSASRKLSIIKIAVILLVLFGMAAAWRWTPLSQWVDLERMASWAGLIEGDYLLGFAVMCAYVVGNLIMMPVLLLIGATAMVFSPFKGGLYALLGCLASASVTYAIGARLGRNLLRRIVGHRINKLGKILARQGLLTMAVVRNLPFAPFTVVNLVAGASRIRFRDYFFGTALGMAPGILGISVFADRLVHAVREPNWLNIAVTLGLAIVLGIAIWWTKKRISREEERN